MLGSTEDSDPIDVQKLTRRVTNAERATVAGLYTEVEVIKQRMTHLYEKLDRIHRLMATFNEQVKQLQEARYRELNVKVNGGPTARGSDD